MIIVLMQQKMQIENELEKNIRCSKRLQGEYTIYLTMFLNVI